MPPAALPRLNATVMLGAAAFLALPAVAFAARGKPVTVKRAAVRSTEALNDNSQIRPTIRLQPPVGEVEIEREDRRDNPLSPRRSDGRSRTRGAVGAMTAFVGAPALNFDGPGRNDTPFFPPDTQGDVGPTQFVAVINGRLRSYSKASGSADGVLDATTDLWWAAAMTPGIGNFTSDPRIRYDRLTGKWVAVMMDLPNGFDATNRIMIAVSSTGVITGSTTWSFYYFTGPAGEFSDYPTLGIDANALYIGTNQFSTSGGHDFLGSDGYVIRKSLLVAGAGATSVEAKRFDLLTWSSENGPVTPQGVDNASADSGAGYFIGNNVFDSGSLLVRRVSSPGTATPTISGNLNVTVPVTEYPAKVPTSGGMALDSVDTRLFAAQMRGSSIWTAHNVGVDATGAPLDGGRAASRWYEISTAGETPSRVQSGTVFDSAVSTPRSYWIPTVAVNGQGSMLIGGSTAGAGAFVDAWYSGRLSSYDSGVTDAPTRYTSSSSSYNAPYDRWGDYSLTRVDPMDDQTMWTIQEYVKAANVYGTRIAKVLAQPPAKPVATSAPVPAGQPSTSVEVTGESVAGSAFFDPGPEFPNRLAVTEDCAGVTVNSVSVLSGTGLSLDLNTTGAGETTCAVQVTNPDGQSVTSDTQILRIEGPAPGGDPETPPDDGSPPSETPPSEADPPSAGPSAPVPVPRVSWKVRRRTARLTIAGSKGLSYSVTARKGNRRARGTCKAVTSRTVRCSIRLSRGRWTISVIARDPGGRASKPATRRVRIR